MLQGRLKVDCCDYKDAVDMKCELKAGVPVCGLLPHRGEEVFMLRSRGSDVSGSVNSW
jgi:hypothetical protein